MAKKKDSLLLWGALALGGYFVWKLMERQASAASATPATGQITAKVAPVSMESILGGNVQYVMQNEPVSSRTDQAIAIYKSLRAGGAFAWQAETMVRQAFPEFRKDMAGE